MEITTAEVQTADRDTLDQFTQEKVTVTDAGLTFDTGYFAHRWDGFAGDRDSAEATEHLRETILTSIDVADAA